MQIIIAKEDLDCFESIFGWRPAHALLILSRDEWPLGTTFYDLEVMILEQVYNGGFAQKQKTNKLEKLTPH